MNSQFGMQPHLLMSPTASSFGVNNSGRRSPSFIGSNQIFSSTSSSLAANNQLTVTGIDEKSLKDVVRVVDKRIEQLYKLTEFSQVLQVENISKISSLARLFIRVEK